MARYRRTQAEIAADKEKDSNTSGGTLADVTLKADLGVDGKYPRAFMVETEEPRRVEIEFEFKDKTRKILKVDTLKSYKDVFGNDLETPIVGSKLYPVNLARVVNCDAEKTIVLY